MSITQAMCTSFKKELLEAKHNFLNSGGSAFKIPLYTSSATINATTTAYTTSNEHASSGNYTAKGNTLTRVDPSITSTTAFTDFADTTWASSTITARGAMIFNEDATGDTSVLVLDFGADKSSSSGDFTIQFPSASSSTAIIRIA